MMALDGGYQTVWLNSWPTSTCLSSLFVSLLSPTEFLLRRSEDSVRLNSSGDSLRGNKNRAQIMNSQGGVLPYSPAVF